MFKKVPTHKHYNRGKQSHLLSKKCQPKSLNQKKHQHCCKIKVLLFLLFSIGAICTSSAQTLASADTVCSGSTESYSVPAEEGSTYTWGIYHSSGTITAGVANNKISIKWATSEGTDSLWIFEINSASCKGDTAKLTVVRVAKPTAVFSSSIVCAGKPLDLQLTGIPPFQVSYTLNGTEKATIRILKSPYLFATAPGIYQLMGVASNGCKNTKPSGTTTAEITPEFTHLKIRRE